MISFKTGALSRSIYKSGKWQLCQMPNILSKCSSSQKLTSNCILASSSFYPSSISSSCAHREESEDGGSGWEVSVFREACLQLCVRFDLIRSSKHEGQERRSGRLGPEPTSERSESMFLQHTEKSLLLQAQALFLYPRQRCFPGARSQNQRQWKRFQRKYPKTRESGSPSLVTLDTR